MSQSAAHDDSFDASLIYRTFNPAKGEMVKEYPNLTDGEAESLLARAHHTYLGYRSIPVVERMKLFSKLVVILEANNERLARQISLEMGKTLPQAKYEAALPIDMLRYYAKHAETLLGEYKIELAGFSRVYSRRESMGVTVGISPWNAPIYQAARVAVPNLLLGNPVILKPAEITIGSTLILEELILEAGFPVGAFQTGALTHRQISRFIADPRVRAVTLTGSDRAGSAVGEQAGRHIKPVVLELGGSDPFIVLDSADVDAAAGTAVACRLALSGQVCVSPKRVIVTDKVADAFTARYVEAFASQKIGDPLDPETTLGPVSSPAAAGMLQQLFQDAVDKGATVLVEGGRPDGASAFFKPVVLTGITREMRLHHEEAFGPIGIVYRVADADAAIALANDSKYGLGGTVYAKDQAEAKRVAEALDTAMVGINQYLGAPVEIPFGGTKASGVGRELGSSGLDAFANIKTYSIA